jgi:hypothetical protein
MWFFLALRTPLVGGAVWATAHGVVLVLLLLLSFHLIFASVRGRFERRLIQVGFLAMVVVTLTHLGILSPYTYAAIRPIWPDQYVMRIGGVLTNADLPHFMDLFKAYTQPAHEAGFSVVLRRFFYEYLWSTAWPIEPLWMAGVAINLLFWFGAMVALLHFASTVVETRRGLTVVVLGLALSLAFAAVVGQPIVYLAAYAWVPMLLWGLLSLTTGKSTGAAILPFALLAAAVATYDVMPVSAAALLVLVLSGRVQAALVWFLVHASVTLGWSTIVLARVLKTFGNPSNAEFLTKSVGAWKQAVLQLDLAAMGVYLWRGLQNAMYAGMGIGFLVVGYLVVESMQSRKPERRTALAACLLLTAMYVASGCLIAPQLPVWSPGGLIPRYSYYYFPASLLGYGLIADRLSKWVTGMIIGVLALVVFADTLGHHEPAMLLHYGNWLGVFLKW